MRFLRRILGLFITLVVLLIVAILVLPTLFDPNDYRDQITQLVKEKTGRVIAIEGDLKLSVFPWLGVKTGRFTVSQPNHLSRDFGGGNMLEVDAASLRLKILPLLKSLNQDKKDIQIDTIVLQKPMVELITTKDGISSLDGLTGEQQTTEPSTEQAAKAGVALVVQGVDLQSGRLIWDDRQSGDRYEVRQLNIQTGDLLGDKLVAVDLSGQLLQGNPAKLTQFSLLGNARIDIDSLAAAAEKITARVQQEGLSGQVSLAKVDFQNGGEINVTNMTSQIVMQTQETGPVDMTTSIPAFTFYQQHNEGVIKSLSSKGKFQQSPFALQLSDIAFNVAQQAASVAALSANAELIDMVGIKSRKLKIAGTDLRTNWALERLSINSINLDSEGVLAQVKNIQANAFMSAPAVTAALSVEPFNLRQLLQQLEIDYIPKDPQALSTVSFSSNIAASMQNATLNNLLVSVDNSKLQGNISVQDFSNPTANFNLSVNSLDLDAVRPVSESETNSGTDNDGGLAVLFALFPLFEQYKANGEVTASRIVAQGLKINDLVINTRSSQATTTIKSSAKLYGGAYDSEVSYKQLTNGGRLEFNNTKINSVALLDMLSDMNVTDQFSGTGSLSVELLVEEIEGQRSSNGAINIGAKDGAIKGVDIQKIVQDAANNYNKLRGREIEDQGEYESETKFASLDGLFKLKDNIVTNDNLDIKAPLFRIRGNGLIDIFQQSLDYTVKVSVVNSLKGQGGEALEKLKGVTLPIRFSGPLTNPKYKVDLKALLKAEINEEKEKYLQEKLGIEGLGNKSSKDVLKAAIGKKLEEKYGEKQQGETQVEQKADSAPQSEVNKGATNDDLNTPPQAAPAPSVESSPQQAEQPKTKEELKKELEEELKRKALEKLFGK